jgi:uncharacterized protein (TIGR03067 family)
MPIVIAILMACLFAAETADDSKSEMAKLDGEWSYAFYQCNGDIIPQQQLDPLKQVTRNGKSTIYKNGQMCSKGKYTIDSSKTPKTIDYFDGGEKNATRLGIYMLDGDTLTVCTSIHSNERPTEFTSKPGSGYLLGIFTRDKK